jgi:hypothetical protein
METVILKVVEGRGKTGLAKKGAKRFLFTDGSFSIFGVFCSKYYSIYKSNYPNGKLTYKELRSQWLKIVLEYENVDVKDYECIEANTILRVGNVSKLQTVAHLNIDKTLEGLRL